MSSAKALNLEHSKNLLFEKGLILYKTTKVKTGPKAIDFKINMTHRLKHGFGSMVRVVQSQDCVMKGLVNSLPNNIFLDQSNLKDFAEDKINVTYVTNFVPGRVENIVGKGENAGYQHFLLFPHYVFKRSLCQIRIVWEKVNCNHQS